MPSGGAQLISKRQAASSKKCRTIDPEGQNLPTNTATDHQVSTVEHSFGLTDREHLRSPTPPHPPTHPNPDHVCPACQKWKLSFYLSTRVKE